MARPVISYINNRRGPSTGRRRSKGQSPSNGHSPPMVSFILASSSPISIESREQPPLPPSTPTLLCRNGRCNPCPSQPPSDDDDDWALPSHQMAGLRKLDELPQRGPIHHLAEAHQSRGSARDQGIKEDPVEEFSKEPFAPTYENGPSLASYKAFTPSRNLPPPSGSPSSFAHENTTRISAPLSPLVASYTSAMASSSPHFMNISPSPVDRAVTLTSHYHHRPLESLQNSLNSSPSLQSDGLCEVQSVSSESRTPNMDLSSDDESSHDYCRVSTLSPQLLHSLDRDENLSNFESESMEIDSPDYQVHHFAHVPLSFVAPQSLSAGPQDKSRSGPRTARSASQASFTKRCRVDDYERYSSSSPASSRASGRHRRSYSSSVKESQVYPLFVDKSQEIGSQYCQFNAHTNHLFSPEPLASSPHEDPSPCFHAVNRKALYQNMDKSPLFEFRFPLSKPTVLRNGDFASQEDSQFIAIRPKEIPVRPRPTLKVAQSSAALFNRHCASLPIGSSVNSLSQVPKTRNRMSLSVKPPNQLDSSTTLGASVDDEFESQLCERSEASTKLIDSCIKSSCYPSENDMSKTWPKETVTSSSKASMADTGPNGKRSAAPLTLNYLHPPLMQSLSILQSPPSGAIVALGSTVQTPVGMAFSEKERAGKILPCHKASSDGLMRITPETMDSLLEGEFDESISRKIIIDCRFRYEYDGGHIRQAINLHDKESVEKMLLGGEMFEGGRKDVPPPSESGKPNRNGDRKKFVVVFHCEYSAMRAPTIAKHLREQDRHINMTYYPALHYPEIYILEGGYAKYHSHSPQHCQGSYVQMDDPTYRHDRQADLSQFRTRENTIFSRTRSYTYGDRNLVHCEKQNAMNLDLACPAMKASRALALCSNTKENILVRNNIVEEEEDHDYDYNGQASSPLFMALAGGITMGKPSLKAQGRSLSLLEKVDPGQPVRIFGNKKAFTSRNQVKQSNQIKDVR